MEGNGERTLELLDDMLKQGVKPDEVVFGDVLTACSHAGLLEQGGIIFKSMQSVHGISPNIVHYGCMVDLLGRARLLEEAVNLIKCMPVEPNDVIWGTLLAACRTHKNIEMAAYAAEQISKLTTQRTGSHVLLSNIYASARKWAEIAKLRLQLKERGISKVPGCSSIEINGVIHEFTSRGGDIVTHVEKSHIELMLQVINSRLRDTGHVPDLDNVLLDVDEKEKKYLLRSFWSYRYRARIIIEPYFRGKIHNPIYSIAIVQLIENSNCCVLIDQCSSFSEEKEGTNSALELPEAGITQRFT